MKIALTANTEYFLSHFEGALIESLKQDGHEVFRIAPDDTYNIQISRKGMNPFEEVRTIVAYYQLLRKLGPDVLLNFTIKPVIYGSLTARLLGVPIINTITGLGSVFVTGGYRKRLVELFYKLLLPGTRNVVLNTDDQKHFANMGIHTDIIPGAGIDINRFSYSPKESHGNIFLFIGRLLSEKGVRDLVEATRMLKEQSVAVDVRFIGESDFGNPSAIKHDELAQWENQGLVTLLGKQEDVRPCIQEADCVVLPSYREGLPTALLEAMAMGRPIITTDAPGCKDLIREPAFKEFLVPTNNPARLAQAMKTFLETTGEQRLLIGKHLRDKVEQHYSTTIVNALYVSMIQTLPKHLN